MKWDSNQTLLIDTNILLVLLVGLIAPTKVGTFRRTGGYSLKDFELARQLAEGFKFLVTTPHILTEVSNLLPEDMDKSLATAMSALLKDIYHQTDERFVPARKLYHDTLARRLGLADTSIIEAAKRGCTILTVDLKLANELNRRNLAVVNFNHIRFPEP